MISYGDGICPSVYLLTFGTAELRRREGGITYYHIDIRARSMVTIKTFSTTNKLMDVSIDVRGFVSVRLWMDGRMHACMHTHIYNNRENSLYACCQRKREREIWVCCMCVCKAIVRSARPPYVRSIFHWKSLETVMKLVSAFRIHYLYIFFLFFFSRTSSHHPFKGSNRRVCRCDLLCLSGSFCLVFIRSSS